MHKLHNHNFFEPIRAEVTGQPSSLKSRERETLPRRDEKQALAYLCETQRAKMSSIIQVEKGEDRDIFEEIKVEIFLNIMKDNKP